GGAPLGVEGSTSGGVRDLRDRALRRPHGGAAACTRRVADNPLCICRLMPHVAAPAMRHFLTTQDYTRAEIERLLEKAARFKKHPFDRRLVDRTLALVFFNPSLRTRASFDVGIRQLGGSAVTLEPGKGSWPIEFEDGKVMDGE